MASVLTVTYDRCGDRIDSGRVVLTVDAGTSPPNWPTSVGTGRPSLDLCPRCLDALAAWLSSPARTSPAAHRAALDRQAKNPLMTLPSVPERC
jgi:hypothetical protein